MRRPIQTLLAYLALVVPPFCGLLAILHFGQAIEPPRSIGGTWDLDAPACAWTGSVHIAQSGPRAQATIAATRDTPRRTLALTLEGDHLVGTGACGVDARVAGDTITGEVRCADCPSRAFRASRRAGPRPR